MTRILVDNHIFTLQRYGGISRIFASYLDPFLQDNIAPVQLNLKFSLELPFHSNLYLKSLDKGFHVPSLRLSRSLSNLASCFPPHLSDDQHPSDYIHLSYYRDYKYLKRLIRTGKPIISTLHDLIPEELGVMPHLVSLKRETLLASSIVLCVSNTTLSKCRQIYPDVAHKLRTLYNFFSPSVSFLQPCNPLGQHDYKYVLGFSGTPAYKNLHLLLKSYCNSSLPQKDIHLVLIGANQNIVQSILASIGYDFKPSIHTNLIHPVSPSDAALSQLYSNACAVFIPSLHEGFSIPVVEALAHDIPLIISDIQVHNEIASSFATLLNPLDMRSWVEAFDSCQDFAAPSQLLASGYNEMLDRFSLSSHLTEYIHLLS